MKADGLEKLEEPNNMSKVSLKGFQLNEDKNLTLLYIKKKEQKQKQQWRQSKSNSWGICWCWRQRNWWSKNYLGNEH